MKKRYLAISSLLLCIALTGCGTTLGENTGIFFSEMGEVVDVWMASSGTSSKTDKETDDREKLEAVSNFTVSEDGSYSFTGNETAAYYVITVCDTDATDDADTYLYSSNRIEEDGSGTYTGNIYDMFTINYGEYLVKCFAYPEIGDETYSRSVAQVANLLATGELLDPQVEYFWNIFDDTLTLQIANMTEYDETCIPDTVDLTIRNSDGTSTALTIEAPTDDNNEITVSDLAEGNYSITAVAHSSSEYVTAADSEEVTAASDVAFGSDNLISDGYSYVNTGLGHGYSWPVGTKDFDPTQTDSLGAYNGTDFVTEPVESTLGTKDNSLYSFEISAAIGFGETGWMELYSDGTCAAYNDTSGPVSASGVSGTWYWNEDNETITINWDMSSVTVSVGN